MTRLVLAVLILAGCSIIPVEAHDIGVDPAQLTEMEEGRYELGVRVKPAVAYLYNTPVLPEHCQFTDSPRGVLGVAWKTFKFTCAQGLTAEHIIILPWRRDGIMLQAKWLDGSGSKRMFRRVAGGIPISLFELQAGSGSFFNAAKRYSFLGVEHILLGFDHLLFVLGLLLIVSGTWMLVKTITAFTVAHSITLGLATLGLVNIPTRPVEASIALSIVFLAVEILHAKQGRYGLTYHHPWVVAFGFGLLHGLGFAGALSEIGLPQSEIPIALLFFNLGVEIGQLVFVFAFLLLRWGLRRLQVQCPRPVQLVPVYAIGSIAMYWLMQRIGSIVLQA